MSSSSNGEDYLSLSLCLSLSCLSVVTPLYHVYRLSHCYCLFHKTWKQTDVCVLGMMMMMMKEALAEDGCIMDEMGGMDWGVEGVRGGRCQFRKKMSVMCVNGDQTADIQTLFGVWLCVCTRVSFASTCLHIFLISPRCECVCSRFDSCSFWCLLTALQLLTCFN